MTLSDLWPGFEGHDIFWSRISEKLARLKTKLLLHKRKVYLPHGMVLFGDLDWPLNSSRGFDSISWASCLTLPTIYTQLRDSTVVIHRQTRENKYQVLKYPPNLTHRWTQFMSMSEVGGRVWTREHSIPVFMTRTSIAYWSEKEKKREKDKCTRDFVISINPSNLVSARWGEKSRWVQRLTYVFCVPHLHRSHRTKSTAGTSQWCTHCVVLSGIWLPLLSCGKTDTHRFHLIASSVIEQSNFWLNLTVSRRRLFFSVRGWS